MHFVLICLICSYEYPRSRILKSLKKENLMVIPTSPMAIHFLNTIQSSKNNSDEEDVDFNTLRNFFTSEESRKRNPSKDISKVR